ncbi:PREDICTED: LOW QUALITY PROTEIN: scavenger receptor class F member 1-like [Leptosomus discolor]|uniref:LOW QUALITY PROTEIN: scavenger receptor class F member 1-like n=1 Tax=Leptosomus discolor TaxID=188344 RepID=UPI0005228CD5|nr:PREDICTED: LOW QUALITY PROTEIN: scavenger receptor class F member 1-like [Leptosomus discolor]
MGSARPILCLQLWLWVQSSAQELDPDGRNVCRVPTGPVCCPGWKQEGRECTAALCEGEDACGVDEVCVKPGVCLCKPGFFGADCSSRCPEQYWGPDCKRSCPCHPNGRCDPASGRCTCDPNHWGGLCQFPCQCGPHGRRDPLTGSLRCAPGTGPCRCLPGWWGRRCSFKCSCNLSPCAQETGKCECKAGFWGPACQRRCDCLHGSCSPLSGHCSCSPGYQGRSCRDPCPAGKYGSQCVHSCGSCKRSQPGCLQPCPRCRRGEVCDPETGSCPYCEPGWTGPSCNSSCPTGTFGDGCQFLCPECVAGSCDPVSGACICQGGYWGASCNNTCPEGYFGVNCSSPCQCSRGTCHPVRGDCVLSLKDHGALAAAILVPLLLLLLCIVCCCCGAGPADARDRYFFLFQPLMQNPVSHVPRHPSPLHRAAVPDDDVVARMKHHVRGVLANLSAMMPCFSLGGYKLPKVTGKKKAELLTALPGVHPHPLGVFFSPVSHHDAEIPFNPSFIEPPSAAWVSDSSFSSFDTDNEGPEYSVPPREGIPLLGGAELQDGVSAPGEALPDPSAFDSEDVSQPFAIPRTSSIAKAKRPSVSFAEGTKFGEAETPSPGRKPKTPWGPSKLSQMLGDAAAEPPTERPASDCYESPEPLSKGEESHRPSPRATPGGRRRVVSGTRHVAQRVEALEAAAKSSTWEAKGKEPNVTTIYMMVGTAGQDPKSEGSGEGPVQAVLKRLGSLQKGKWATKEEPKVRRSIEGIQKPPRRALAQRRDSVNSCKQRESVPGAPDESSPGKHPGERQSFLLASPSPKITGAQDVASDAIGATERSKSPEIVLSLEEKGEAAPEEEPKYENFFFDSPPGPAKELPAAPAAT